MIVRNEERHLAACLSSLRTLVDELVIVDTGSTDSTISIARRFGARVIRARWPGSFAAARNISLDHARGEWIFYIDADERVRKPVDRAKLRRLLRQPRIGALTVDLFPTSESTAFSTLRLFRNDPRVRFEGAMHESPMRGITEMMRANRCRGRHSDLKIDHVGYDDDHLRKARRNLPLLRRALVEQPGHIWNRSHLALVYVTLGRARDAERAWRRAIADLHRTGSRNLLDSVAHSGYANWLLANDRDASRVIADGLARFPGNMELHWLRARSLMKQRRWRQAIPILEALIEHRAGRPDDRQLPFRSAIFGDEALAALGTCCFQLRRYHEAAAWYRRASRRAPTVLEYRVKGDLARQLARRTMLSS